MSLEYKHQKLRQDLAGLILHWRKLAAHVKQKPLPRKVITDLADELQKVVDRD